MRYCDPRKLDRLPAPVSPAGYLVLSGGRHTPGSVESARKGGKCPSCGCGGGDRLHRRRSVWNARKGVHEPYDGYVACVGCDRGSRDHEGDYPGHAVGSYVDPDYPVDQPVHIEPDDGLAGGKGPVKLTRKVKRANQRKEKASA